MSSKGHRPVQELVRIAWRKLLETIKEEPIASAAFRSSRLPPSTRGRRQILHDAVHECDPVPRSQWCEVPSARLGSDEDPLFGAAPPTLTPSKSPHPTQNPCSHTLLVEDPNPESDRGTALDHRRFKAGALHFTCFPKPRSMETRDVLNPKRSMLGQATEVNLLRFCHLWCYFISRWSGKHLSLNPLPYRIVAPLRLCLLHCRRR